MLTYYYTKFINQLAKMLANCKITLIKQLLISWFVKYYSVNLQEAEFTNISDYKSFNDFFTRRLQPKARTYSQEPSAIISPADGIITQYGIINNNKLLSCKNNLLSIATLLTKNNIFINGQFINIYLAPHNYHRIHMPQDALLETMIYIPGRFFSVNPKTVAIYPDLFIKNERVVAIFNTDLGKMAIILIGALIVSNIVVTWHGEVFGKTREITTWDYKSQNIKLSKFQEMGLFKLGSTVIVLWENNNINFLDLWDNKAIKVGEQIAVAT